MKAISRRQIVGNLLCNKQVSKVALSHVKSMNKAGLSKVEMNMIRQSQQQYMTHISMVNQNTRMFFGKNKKEGEQGEEKETREQTDDDKETKQKEDKEAETASEEKAAESKKDNKSKKGEQTPTESSSSGSEDFDLSAEDMKKIKELIKDQDEIIDNHETKIEALDKQVKDYKQKLMY
jgi:hypothetical protein